MPPFDGTLALNYAYPLALVAYNDPWNSPSPDQQPPASTPLYPLLSTFTNVGEILVSPDALAPLVANTRVGAISPTSSQKLLHAMLLPRGAGTPPSAAGVAAAEGLSSGSADLDAPLPLPSLSMPLSLEPGTGALAIVPISQRFGWVCVDPSASRLIVTFRGTQTAGDWLDDLDFISEPYKPVAEGGTVHQGFQFVYYSIRDSLLSLVTPLLADAKELFVVGHSLGAALATLAMPDLLAVAAAKGLKPSPTLYNFASPRVGHSDFKSFFNQQSPEWRVVNVWDVVPHVPPVLAEYVHVGSQLTIDSGFSFDIAHNHRLPTGYLPGLEVWVARHAAVSLGITLTPRLREVPLGVSD